MNIQKAAFYLNKTAIPSLKSPFHQKIYWFQYHPTAPKSTLHAHRHTFFEVHFVLEGEAHYLFEDGDSCLVQENEYILIAPSVVHTLRDRSKTKRKFSFAFAIDSANALGSALVSTFSSQSFTHGTFGSSLHQLFNEAISVSENPTPLTSHRLQGIAFGVTEELLRLQGGLPKNVVLPEEKQIDLRIPRAKRYVTDNIRRNFTLADVAAAVYLSEKQLTRIFLQTEGISLKDFIKNEKLKEAKELLSASDTPLRNVSEMLGFSNEYNFIRFFKDAEGIPPGQFRKIIKNKEHSTK